MSHSALSYCRKEEKDKVLWCPHLDHIIHITLAWLWNRVRVKASEIWCPVSGCAFGNQFVASILFLVGNIQLRKAITISILRGKHKDWFGLDYKLLSFSGVDPPGQFEVRLFPLSLFYLVEASERHKVAVLCLFRSCRKRSLF